MVLADFGLQTIAQGRRVGKWLGLCAVLAGTCLAAPPATASESLSFSYGPVIRSLKVSSLERFAADGTVEDDLAFFLAAVKPEDYPMLRAALTAKAPIDPLIVSRFFYSGIGEDVLERLGKGITLLRGGNGKPVLRAALIQAAFSADGLSLLSVLEQLPANIQIHGEDVIAADKAGRKVLAATEQLGISMRALTAAEAKTQPSIDYATLKDPRKPGSHAVSKEVWNLTDAKRNRSFYVDVYIPSVTGSEPIPVIVFSHGLASRPEDFAAPLQQIASHGFLVVAPQHPGSDTIWLKEMLQGLHRDIFDVNDFTNRPKDISFVLDELERRNGTQFNGRLELRKVGIAGHSFGGYTALAVGGASIDPDNLRAECERPFAALDIALLLQCQALRIPPEQLTNLQDSRAAAIFAANPVNRSIFGKQGIEKIRVPIVMASGSYDPATPPALEQAASFTWLKAPEKYWLIVEGQAHVNFNQIDPGIKKAIESITDITLPDQGLIGSYIQAISLPFFEVHLRNNKAYEPFLRSSYAEYLAKDERFKLFMISGASTEALKADIEAFRKKYP
ncbi:alpha/beta hydrolase [Synechococcus sp. GFB01]|uniref:alpha/beta hydrolase n=1 Tax=Synechococcus sp. GFB01 TaxID=1662190 RepID=UPI00064FA339|nr:alpha/beta hydrolase [Synechococcus sp. GFB01]KMM17276.1 dienelactone hydrolase [Synechococcus sp. GFB01]